MGNRGKGRRHLTKAQTVEVQTLYLFRAKLVQIASQYTLHGLAARYGCCHNTIWNKVTGFSDLIKEGVDPMDLIETTAGAKSLVELLIEPPPPDIRPKDGGDGEKPGDPEGIQRGRLDPP